MPYPLIAVEKFRVSMSNNYVAGSHQARDGKEGQNPGTPNSSLQYLNFPTQWLHLQRKISNIY